MNPIHIIAEAGTNHNADPNAARRLVDVAREAGADSVKFQIIYPEGLYVEKVRKEGEWVDNEVVAARRKGMLSDDAWRDVARHAREIGMPMSASVFDSRSLSLLEEFAPPYVKIASCDLNNIPLLEAAAATGRKLIVSTGMSTLAEVEESVRAIEATGHKDLVLMHCVSVYPCPTSNMNLGFLETLKREFGYPIGLSDHTENSLAAAAATALGVTWIEKHFTLDRTSPGFDHAYAMEPKMLADYVADIRQVEAAMRPPVEKVGPQEANVSLRARRALYAARDIAPGERITSADVLIVRPAGPLKPRDLRTIVGSRTTRAICRFEPLDLAHLDRAS